MSQYRSSALGQHTGEFNFRRQLVSAVMTRGTVTRGLSELAPFFLAAIESTSFTRLIVSVRPTPF